MKHYLFILMLAIGLFGCKKSIIDPTPEPEFFVNEDPATFAEIGSIDIGDVGAAEISAYDPATKR
ncbi:MAG: alkaline phosphatase, partial [Sphingobacteriaceae bacterium]